MISGPRDGDRHNGMLRDGASPQQEEAVTADTETTITDPPVGSEQETETPRDGDVAEMEKRLKKANKEAESYRLRLKEIDDRDKTEQEKLTEKVTSLESSASAAELRALRLEVALDKGLPKSFAARLQGATVEEIEADAEELLSTIRTTKRAAASFDGGARTSPPSGEDDMNKVIRNRMRR